MEKQLKLGLIGFGVVGEGVYHVINNTPSLNASIKKIVIKHPEKLRNAPKDLFTTNIDEILLDSEIDVVVELIDDAIVSFQIVKSAMQNGKHIVSANKKMIAYHLEELIALQRKYQVSFLYEGAVCGSIPIIRNLEEYFDNDLLNSISGIVNGSTNFILTNIVEKGLTYHDALKLAQDLGFAESNPMLDVEGIDAVNKLCILLKHTFGIHVLPSEILHKGISQIHENDYQFAFEKGYEIKLVANAFRISDNEVVSYVLPEFVKPGQQLFQVKNEYNGVLLSSTLSDEQFLYGKGAGRYPTSSAVISDIAALRYGYKYEYKKSKYVSPYHITSKSLLTIYISYSIDTEIDEHDFDTIFERHASAERCYIIGEMQLEKLIQSRWIHDSKSSLIVFGNQSSKRKQSIAIDSINFITPTLAYA